MLEILKDSGYEDYECYCEWPGDEFDSEEFGLDEMNVRFERS